MKLRITWQYLVAFAALTILCGTSHEFAHHLSGAAICGGFGVKTFNSFDLIRSCESNPYKLWADVAGPVFTFGLMWWGMFMLRSADDRARRLGFALIFANFPINRMGFVLFGWNDEQWVAHNAFPSSRVAYVVAILLVWIACLPPLIAAYRAIANRRRPLWFAGFFILPFVFVLTFAGAFLENYLLLGHHVLATSVIGVPWLIILVELLSLATYYALRASISDPAGPLPPLVERPASA